MTYSDQIASPQVMTGTTSPDPLDTDQPGHTLQGLFDNCASLSPALVPLLFKPKVQV
jgi:hypothetical protein